MFMDFAAVSNSAKSVFNDISDDELNWLYSASLIAVCVTMVPYAYIIETTQKTYYAYGSGVCLVVASVRSLSLSSHIKPLPMRTCAHTHTHTLLIGMVAILKHE